MGNWLLKNAWIANLLVILLFACTDPNLDIPQQTGDTTETADVTTDVLKIPTFKATIVATPNSGNAPLPVDLTLSVEGVDKSELFVVWTFGDGEKSNPYDLGSVDGKVGDYVQHSYGFKGTYQITATVGWSPKPTVRVEATTSVTVSDPAALSIASDVRVLSPLVVAPGDDVTLTFAVKNDGDEITQPFDIAVYLSTDDTVDKDDALAITLTEKGMASGQPKASYLDFGALGLPGALPPVKFKIPQGLPDDTYFVLVRADAGQVVNELDRSDNTKHANDAITVNTVQAAKPDLTISAPIFDSTKTYSPGDSLGYTQNVSNIGAGEAKQVKYAVFLSEDQKLNFDPTKDPNDPSQGDKILTSLANSTLVKLAPGATLPLTYALQVPKNTPDGNYYLIAKIDVLDKIDESNESNNIAATSTTVTVKLVVKQGQDLGLIDMTVQPKGTYLNGTVSVKYHVKNLGTEQSKPFPATVYFCNGKAFSEDACVLNKTTFTINPLAVGEELTDAQIVTINPLTPVTGVTWFIYLRLDPANTIAELDETNNVKVFDNLIITATANVDVWPSDIGFHPVQVEAGGQLKISYAIHNDGTTGSGASTTWIALSASGVCSAAAVTSGQAILLKKVISSGVEGLDVAQVSDVVTVPASLDHNISQYTLCIVLDGDNVLDKDKNKGNNAAGSVSKVTVLNPQGGCYEDPADQSPADNNTPQKAVAPPSDPTTLLGSCGNEDWYKIDVQQGWSLIVSMDVTASLWTTPVPANLDIDLYAPDQTTVLDTQKILSMNKKASALTVAQAGTYYIRVYPHAANAKAQYTLNVQAVKPSAGIDLYAAHLAVAPAVTFPGGLIKAKLNAANLGATAAGDVPVRFLLSGDLTADAADTLLLDTTVKAVGAAGTFALDQAIELPVVKGGTWYLLAVLDPQGTIQELDKTNNVAFSNPLSLSSTVACATDTFSGNHSVDNAADLPPIGAKYSGLNVCPGLEDWFRLDIPGGKAFSAKVDWLYEPGKGLLGVQILDASQTAVVAGSVTTSNTQAKLPYVQQGGTFYVHVYVLPESGQALPKDYDLNILVTEPDPGDVCLPDYYEPNNSWQSGQSLGCGTATQTLCLNDEDWFHITLAANESVGLSLDNPAFVLRVFGDPQKPALSTISGPGTLPFVAPTSGVYHVQVAYKSANAKPASFTYVFKVDGGNGVDLISAIDSVFPLQIVQGEDVYLTVTLSNECKDVAVGFNYAYYFSSDATLDASDVFLGTHEVPQGLGAKSKLKRDDKAIIPLSAVPGPAFVILAADSTNNVAETQELNNDSSASLTVIPLCIGDALEPNGAPQIAAPLPMGKTEALSLCPYDLDWYQISLNAGQTLTVTMAFDQLKGDLDMRLYKVAQFGQPVAVGATKSAPETFTYTADETTKYFVRIDGFNGDANGYALFACISVGGTCVECASNADCPVGEICDVTKTTCAACTVGSSDCLDGDPCTSDACDPKLGCLHLPSDATCSDGQLCTVGDQCAQGVCLSGSTTTCDDADVCTNDACDPVSGCGHTFNSAPCFDGDMCSTGDKCVDGSCISGTSALNCDDANVCTQDSCFGPTGCGHIGQSGTTCDDGDACKLGEVCDSGVCLSGSATPDCNDNNQCTDDACVPSSGCQNSHKDGSCDDGNPCTAVDSCSGGNCVGSVPLFCDDGNVCTSDACAGVLGCTHGGLSGVPCTDGLFCTSQDTCNSGVCTGVTGKKCDDNNVCTNDACSEDSGCTHTFNTATCSDGLFCTSGDVCGGGTCAGVTGSVCVDGNACTSDSCDEIGGCTFTPTNGVICSDGDACSVNDSCQDTVCKAGTPKDCDDGSECTTDSCAGGTCSNLALPDDTTCSTGVCTGGVCSP